MCGAGARHTMASAMSAADFRRMALALDGASEGSHMAHPDFRVMSRIFATLHSGDQCGMVALTPEQQQDFIRREPLVFAPESGAWGRSGSTRVQLAAVSDDVLGEALTLAWQNAVRRGTPKRSRGAKPHASA